MTQVLIKRPFKVGEMSEKWPLFGACSWCRGIGVVASTEGEPIGCTRCNETGRVIARDQHGRFLPWVAQERADA